jgi:hypothetical protein
MSVDDIKRSGRATQGVIVMRLKGGDETVSALAPVVDSDNDNGTTDDVAPEPVPSGAAK